ncbi:glutaredoxin domain-containing cysteine-rich protein 2 [Callorhinchus milii]|nr:glutaredoxin domain-containing cysteine-rich protein 2 [Callorhinchus milii]
MDELRAKLSQKFEGKPRKVRFRISSAYSGRVLKQVYEDGLESEEPEEQYPGGTVKARLCQGIEPGRAGAHQHWDSPFPSPTSLIAQRINVFRDGERYSMTGRQTVFSNLSTTHSKASTILDFGKIIIYTSNLRIVRSSANQKELVSDPLQNRSTPKDSESLDRDQGNEESGEKQLGATDKQDTEEGQTGSLCPQCAGAGCAPCSLCHGSKLSMFANRFKESFRAIRCPGCDENGEQPCQNCAH